MIWYVVRSTQCLFPGAPIPHQNPAPPSATATARNYRTAEDALLVKRMSDGDPHALGMLYDRLSVAIYSHVAQLLGNPAEAEDVVEETFWNAWRGAKEYDPGLCSVPAWILGMARRRTVDRLKARASTVVVPRKAAALEVPGLAALEGLPAGQREAVGLALLKGMSYEEISAALKVPVAAVEASTRAGMDTLRTTFGAVTPEAPPTAETPE